VHVGRQPIFDAAGDVVAYELLFRGRMDAIDAARRDAYATSQVILNAFAEFGVGAVVGDRTCFLNMTREFLVGDLSLPFGPEGVVLEILETVAIDDAVVTGVTGLVDAGYRIALDDFVPGSAQERLLPLASYVKIDLLTTERGDLDEIVRSCRAHPQVTLVAEGLETGEDLALCDRYGFELRQGYLLSRPQVLTATALTPSRMRSLELLAALSSADGDLDEVLSIVASDPALTLRLLRAANSAALGIPVRVSSVRQAVVLVGLTQVRQWAMLMSVEDVAGANDAQMADTLTRARLCTNIAPSFDAAPDAAFIAGLIAGIATVLGTTPAALAHQLPLHLDIRDALTRGAGPLGQLLRVVDAYERGDLAEAATAYRGDDLVANVMAAMRWSTQTLAAVR
jgi:c-di-GMP-related signal transduction protein